MDLFHETGRAWLPKNEKSFDLVEEMTERLSRSVQLQRELFDDPGRMVETVAAIKEVEHEADQLTRTVIVRIDKSFVTPIDREDLHLLASHLDEVIDLVDGTARRAQMFHLAETRPAARQLAEIIVRAAGHIEMAVKGIRRPHSSSTSSTASTIQPAASPPFGTRVLSPLAAVAWAALFNFKALFIFGTAVAKGDGRRSNGVPSGSRRSASSRSRPWSGCSRDFC